MNFKLQIIYEIELLVPRRLYDKLDLWLKKRIIRVIKLAYYLPQFMIIFSPS
ncbi:MAG TPA: hypothetical protein VJ937_10350 [Salinivirga sp.]|uniref:hypothetical protein n=1 Tax=Salinivirga sp. TaxID=1970192 RepID=UPI002B48F0D8|nr:hypothetical protein [Salinivirga sp.]HKK59868.1 hypothetical protein [Salinivirga sp.]